MKPVNIELDEKAIDAAMYISQFCKEHPNCKGCLFSFSHVCVLKWTQPEGWNDSVTKLLERRKISCYTDKTGR